MSDPSSLPAQIETLAGLLQDPYRRAEEIAAMLRHPFALQIVAGGAAAAQSLLDLLGRAPPFATTRVIVLLLSQFGSEAVYRDTIARLGATPPALAMAFEDGVWRMPRPADAVAHDLVDIARRSGHSAALLLLQRPPAAAAVKSELKEIVRSGSEPFARDAMAALSYALEPADISVLALAATRVWQPSVSAPAGIALLRLGSTAGWAGIEAGLTALDEELRVVTYTELQPFVPAAARRSDRFDPRQPPAAGNAGLARLRRAVTGENRGG